MTTPAHIITIADVRAAGLSVQQATDPQVTDAIAVAEAIIAEETDTWFVPRTFTADTPLLVDGSGIARLELPAPIITLSQVLEMGNALNLTDLAIYGDVASAGEDRRFSPCLHKKPYTVGVWGSSPFYSGAGSYDRSATPFAEPRWIPGPQTVALVGTFGFVERDGVSPPPLMKKTALRLVLREWRPVGDPLDAEAHASGTVVSESTPGHSYTQANYLVSNGPTGNPLIDDVLARYRRRFGGVA